MTPEKAYTLTEETWIQLSKTGVTDEHMHCGFCRFSILLRDRLGLEETHCNFCPVTAVFFPRGCSGISALVEFLALLEGAFEVPPRVEYKRLTAKAAVVLAILREHKGELIAAGHRLVQDVEKESAHHSPTP